MKPRSSNPIADSSPDEIGRETVCRPPTAADLHLARIVEYKELSLQKEDPLESCLGGLNSGLMGIGLRIQEAIEVAVCKANGDMDEIVKLKAGFDIYAVLNRQIDRLANLGLRLEESNRQTETNLDKKPPSRRNLMVQRRRIPKT